jgi:surface carbohydrate biosynthesis protein (TIGR04326 family)
MSKNTITIWDIKKNIRKTPKNNSLYNVLWNGYNKDNDPSTVSILKIIELNPLNNRRKYLEWSYRTNQRLNKCFKINKDFSFWSMSLYSEKCNFVKSPEINNAIKLIAFEDWIDSNKVENIILHTSNKSLLNTFDDWCNRNDINLTKHFYSERKSIKRNLKHILFNKLPYSLQSILWLFIYIKNRWSQKGIGLSKWKKSEAQITFVSYLVNLNYKKIKIGDYESHFWGDLPEKLKKLNYKVNWLHIWVESDNLKKSKDVIKSLNKVNEKSKDEQAHVTLDSFLSINLIFTILYKWIHIIIQSFAAQSVFFQNQNNKFNLNILQKEDWQKSIYGVEAIKNILFYELLNSAFESLEPQKLCCYLQENQGWEFGLISSWRQKQKGFLYGVPHFTIRFWDLRYFFDKRYFKKQGKGNNLRPDKILINGQIPRKQLIQGGYPKNDLINVEALRYNYISARSFKKQFKNKNTFKILIVGDIDINDTNQQLSDLSKALELIPLKISVSLKPHPATNINDIDINILKVSIVYDKLDHLFNQNNLILCSSNSSSAVEAYYLNLPLAIYLNQKTLNLSPLKNVFDASFYSSYSELEKIILKYYYSEHKSKPKNKINYFHLDEKIPSWLKLFKSL